MFSVSSWDVSAARARARVAHESGKLSSTVLITLHRCKIMVQVIMFAGGSDVSWIAVYAQN